MKSYLGLLLGLLLTFALLGSANATSFDSIVDWDNRGNNPNKDYIQLHENNSEDDGLPFDYSHIVTFDPAAIDIT